MGVTHDDCLSTTTCSHDNDADLVASLLLLLLLLPVTCPLGVKPGSRLNIRTPSGLMPTFSALVPPGHGEGDVFVVQAPTEEALVQADYEDVVMAGTLCGLHPCGTSYSCAAQASSSSSVAPKMPWDFSCQTLEDWLRPTPVVMGRPVANRHCMQDKRKSSCQRVDNTDKRVQCYLGDCPRYW